MTTGNDDARPLDLVCLGDRYGDRGHRNRQLLATQWLWTYNNERPHTAIGGVPPGKLLDAA